ncbi:MAG TPA: 2,3-bisphosphoglycerate-independent phosphoglycerate mutase [Gordonibacter urolithinfaciens]|uniref:2,3-bisphosphoglycerate-independent phosphoglycerate mutase n=2 Tax=Gordonibacter urolithinfaciens TaxID=1335613 RepID=A0A6N8ILG4_9ACTN|nr:MULTISPECIES: 2,3-bisphosphoglycerate-independent phosphoglycerate mutase [Gordonibacter]MDN4510266.1 2,3-bisphosphoglycerate-independent phosphoglycerate mutase [Gordonibacter sp. RACS_AR49]MVM54846.1 2,3-bisphosphoglycerate-independent phosphoglycerate mutase [Gordonibacter urolithinfaciens]MVN16595.1 2,3-bisphosphoglycerate-independent phosphoglycerate mutase [Gordonibacter urolithinfaciens]MVN37946.1 2,3-bisphosphoglycerate-independent phosphoglycerate mutase [Gordonibacter urolithinfaci
MERADLALPACLIIMDGFGLAEPGPGNAISQARTPNLDALFAERPWTRLEASGEAVGLPEGQMGNSEVGHLNIGAGRVVFQELTRINRACADGSLAANPVLNDAFAAAREPGAALHLMGLVSDGGVHSSNEHLYALARAAKEAGVGHIAVHCFMDGRDVPPKSGAGYLEELEAVLAELTDDACAAEIASISGRYFAMDRDNRWERVEQAWRAIVAADPCTDAAPAEVMAASYAEGVTDEFVVPTALSGRGVQDGDAVVFFNFRPDRAREITRALVDPAFEGFGRSRFPQVSFVCLTEYDPEIPAPVACPKEFPGNVLADVLAAAGLRQYHIAETEKYAHVTFFLNGGREEPKTGEERALIPSPKVATYDLKPEMSEPDVAATLAAAIDADEADVYLVNFANCDMVGHTGVIPAAVAAVEAVDAGVGEVLAALERKGGVALITADHGNADKMLGEDGSPFTAHTTAPVPLVLADFAGTGRTLDGREGALCDIAPTLLELMGLPKPAEMTGRSLLA